MLTKSTRAEIVLCRKYIRETNCVFTTYLVHSSEFLILANPSMDCNFLRTSRSIKIFDRKRKWNLWARFRFGKCLARLWPSIRLALKDFQSNFNYINVHMFFFIGRSSLFCWLFSSTFNCSFFFLISILQAKVDKLKIVSVDGRKST